MAYSLPDTPGHEEYLKFTNHRFSLETLETLDLEEIMTKQQPKLSCGLYRINNKIVKTASMQLAVPMTVIVNKSIKEGIVPLTSKKAPIAPLYKKGSAR